MNFGVEVKRQKTDEAEEREQNHANDRFHPREVSVNVGEEKRPREHDGEDGEVEDLRSVASGGVGLLVTDHDPAVPGEEGGERGEDEQVRRGDEQGVVDEAESRFPFHFHDQLPQNLKKIQFNKVWSITNVNRSDRKNQYNDV